MTGYRDAAARNDCSDTSLERSAPVTMAPDWRADLPRLAPLNLPLLPCGAGREQKGPIDPATGYGLSGWETARFSVDQIQAMNGVVRSVGTRTGDGLLCFDLDGATALELALQHGCDPPQAQTWQVHRDTDPYRLKVIWRLTPEQQAAIGAVTVKAHTQHPPRDQDGKPTAKGEAVEVFHHPGRQILLLGQHVPSDGFYIWPDGQGPEALAPITPAWWALAQAVARGELGLGPEQRTGSTTRSTASSRNGSDRRAWQPLAACPICGRDTTGYCAESRADAAIRCFHGSTFSPEISHGVLAVGATITGRNGTVYGYCGTEQQSNGDTFSTFRVHQDRRSGPQEPQQGASNAAHKAKPDRFVPWAGSSARWGSRKLGHSRAMECFDRCVQVQTAKERNSLRRRARLLKAAADLGLSKYVNRQELAQRVLEAKDQQEGRTFATLSAADRVAMERPRVQFLVPGLVPERDATILGGRAKVGKTRLAMAIAGALLNGSELFDLGAPTPRDVILVSDDQADGDTADMLDELGIWDHPRLLWSRHFRLTENDLEALLQTVKAHPGALVILDSLRSIGRSLQHGENDPELGVMLYDLKGAVTEAGGTLLLIHHCNKSEGLIGVEALSGHNAIAGAANGILTLHYLPDDKGRPRKDDPQRRLVREARSGQGFDLVISPLAGTGTFYRVGTFADWQRSQEEAQAEQKATRTLTKDQRQALEVLTDAGGWLTRRQVCDAMGIDWGDKGKGAGPKRVWNALGRLVEDRLAESQRAGNEATYRASHGTQLLESVESLESPSDAKASGRRVILESVESLESPSDAKASGPVRRGSPDGDRGIPEIPDSGIPQTDCSDRRIPEIPEIPSGGDPLPAESAAPPDRITVGSAVAKWSKADRRHLPGWVVLAIDGQTAEIQRTGSPGRLTVPLENLVLDPAA